MAATYAAIRVAVAGTCLGQQIVNVFNVADIGDVDSAAIGVGDAFVDAFDALLPDTYIYDSAHAIDMSTETGGTFTYSLSSNGSGGGTDALEMGVAGIIRWSDTITGRAFRPGRTYIGPFLRVYAGNNGLTINAGGATALQAAATSFLNSVNSLGSLVIVHGLGKPSQAVAPIVSASIAPNLAHLDSRRK